MFIGESLRSWRFFETGACCRQDFWLFCWPQKDGKTRCGREKYLAFWKVVKGRMCDGLSWSWPCYNFSKDTYFWRECPAPSPSLPTKNAKKLEEFPQRNSGIRILLFFLGGCRRKPLKKKKWEGILFLSVLVHPPIPKSARGRMPRKKEEEKKWGKRGWGGGKKMTELEAPKTPTIPTLPGWFFFLEEGKGINWPDFYSNWKLGKRGQKKLVQF